MTHGPAMYEMLTAKHPEVAAREGKRQLETVLVLCDHAHVNGGQAKIAIDSALQLKSAGLDVCFIAAVGPVDDRLLAAGIECHALGDYDILSDPNRIRAMRSGIWNFEAARVVTEWLAQRDLSSTLIHVHGWAKGLSPSIGPVVTRSEAAHVYTLHEYFLACPNGGFYDYGAGKICKRRALGLSCLTARCDSRSDLHKAWRVARQLVLKTAGTMPAGLREVIYLAPEQRSMMAPYIPGQARWHYLPNPAGLRPGRRVLAEQNDLFLFIGRLSPEKGAEVAARAARQAGVKIVFCGDGPSRDAVARANPDAQLLGWLPKEELDLWMSRARCVLFPSLWLESYGLVVADALRAGLPVIVSDVTVSASLVKDGVDGLHSPPGDVVAWAHALTQMRSDVLIRKLSQNAFRAGEQLLGHAEYTARLLDIYRSVLSRKHQLQDSLESRCA